MTILEEALNDLKRNVAELGWDVYQQVVETKQALLNFDQGRARMVNEREKYIDAREIQLDRECENILALYSPVATDLRLVIASLKIILYLERVADNSNSIAKYVLQTEQRFPDDLLEELKIPQCFQTAEKMVQLAIKAYETEDTSLTKEIFELDSSVNEANKKAAERLENLVRKDISKYLHPGLYALSTVRKLERIGDLAKNIMEEVVFYVEAKILRHKKKLEGEKWKNLFK